VFDKELYFFTVLCSQSHKEYLFIKVNKRKWLCHVYVELLLERKSLFEKYARQRQRQSQKSVIMRNCTLMPTNQMFFAGENYLKNLQIGF
jgi:hypothetical protein